MQRTIISKFNMRQAFLPHFLIILQNSPKHSRQRSIDYFSLSISLGVTSSTKKQFSPQLSHKHLQKWLRNLVSRSETIVFGTPCKRIISRKNKSATLTASSLL